MNVLLDPWVPLLLPDGTVAKQRMVDIPTSGALRVEHARADYSALITELAVCVYQTLAAPHDRIARRALVRAPDLALLDKAFRTAAPAFEIFGDGARFLQSPEAIGGEIPVRGLVPEGPGANAVAKNTDLFVHRSALDSMCPHCAPAALFGNQAHAGQGGSGYKVALRGGSALAALIEAPTLWETICLNLLDRDTYTDRYCLEGGAEEDFPWTTGLKVFSKEAIGPRELGAHAALWWMPRALRLHESANADGTSCSTCGEVHPTHIRTASRDKTAARPPEGLRHPHTAWCMLKNEKEIDGVKTKVDVEAAVMVPSEGYMLGDWLALTLGAQTPTRRILAGLPAMAHLSRAEAARATLRVFGPRYATATFLTWFDEAGPLLAAADAEHLRQLRAEAEKLVAEAQRVLVIVRTAARKNLGSKKRPLAVPLSSSPGQLESELAGRARSLISRALAKVDGAGGSLTQDDYEQFCSQLRKAAVSLFNRALVIDFANETLSHKLVLLSAKTYSLIYPKAKPASNQDAIAA